MKEYILRKAELLDILQENRANHAALYAEARANFLQAAEEELINRLDKINSGQIVRLDVEMPVPEDHTRDYDRVIRMLGLDVNETVVLSDAEAKVYVMDQWPWRRAWIQNTTRYTGSADFFAAEEGGY